jgi:hypothetical protein
MTMLRPLTKSQKWIAYTSLVFVGLWSLWLVYLMVVYLSDLA